MGDYIIINEAHAYPSDDGDHLVAEVRGARTRCSTYTAPGDSVPRKVLDEFELPALPASISDHFGYCEQLLDRNRLYICYGFLARGRFVSDVIAVHFDLDHAREKVRSLVPTAAMSLLTA